MTLNWLNDNIMRGAATHNARFLIQLWKECNWKESRMGRAALKEKAFLNTGSTEGTEKKAERTMPTGI